MSQYSEYTGSSVKNSSCAYAQLCSYNQGGKMAPVNPKQTSGVYVVPSYGAIGYNALTHGQGVPGCGGYFNIKSAYGAGAGSCNTTYTTKLCGGGCQ